jgi:hypothetical protein
MAHQQGLAPGTFSSSPQSSNMGPDLSQYTKYHHSRPYHNLEGETGEERQDSNAQGRLSIVSCTKMVEVPVLMALHVQMIGCRCSARAHDHLHSPGCGSVIHEGTGK